MSRNRMTTLSPRQHASHGTRAVALAGGLSKNMLSVERVSKKSPIEDSKTIPAFSKPIIVGLKTHNHDKYLEKAPIEKIYPSHFLRNSPPDNPVRPVHSDNLNDRKNILTDICKTCKDQAKKIEMLQNELADVNYKVHASEKKIKEQNYYVNELDSLRTNALLKNKGTKEIESMKEDYNKKINEMSKNIKDLESQNKYFIQENLSIKRELEKEIQSYKDKIKDLKNDNEQLKRKDNETHYDLRKETEQFGYLKEYVRKLKEDNEEKVKIISGLKYDNDKFNKTLEENKRRISHLEKEIEKEKDFNRVVIERYQEALGQRSENRTSKHKINGSGSDEKIKNQHENLQNLFGTLVSPPRTHYRKDSGPEKEKKFKELLERNKKLAKENESLVDDLFSHKKINEKLLLELKNKDEKMPMRMTPSRKPREFQEFTSSPDVSRHTDEKSILNERNMLRMDNTMLLDENRQLQALLEKNKKEFMENNKDFHRECISAKTQLMRDNDSLQRKFQNEVVNRTKLEKIAKVYENEIQKIRECLEKDEADNKSPTTAELNWSEKPRTPERVTKTAKNFNEYANRNSKNIDLFPNYHQEYSPKLDASPKLEIVQQTLDDTIMIIQRIISENRLLKQDQLLNPKSHDNSRLLKTNAELFENIKSLEDRNKNLIEEVRNTKRKNIDEAHEGAQHSIEILKSEIEGLKKEAHRMENQYFELEEKVSQDQIYIHNLDTERLALKNECGKLLSEKQERNSETKGPLAEKIKEFNEALNIIKDKEQEITFLIDDCEDKKQKLREAYEKIEKDQKKVNEVLKENAFLEKCVESAENNERIAEEQNEGLKIDLESLRRILENEINERESTIKEQEVHIKELVVALNSLQEKCSQAQISKISEKAYSTLLADHKKISEELQDLNTEKIFWAGELNEKEGKLNEARKELGEEILKMEAELQYYIERSKKLENEINQRSPSLEEPIEISIDYRTLEEKDYIENENGKLKNENLEKSRIIKELQEALSKKSEEQQEENFEILIEYQPDEHRISRSELLGRINDLEREIYNIRENNAIESENLRGENLKKGRIIEELQETLATSVMPEENIHIQIEYEPEENRIEKNQLIEKIAELGREVYNKDLKIKDLEMMIPKEIEPESINIEIDYSSNIEEIEIIRKLQKEKKSKLKSEILEKNKQIIELQKEIESAVLNGGDSIEVLIDYRPEPVELSISYNFSEQEQEKYMAEINEKNEIIKKLEIKVQQAKGNLHNIMENEREINNSREKINEMNGKEIIDLKNTINEQQLRIKALEVNVEENNKIINQNKKEIQKLKEVERELHDELTELKDLEYDKIKKIEFLEETRAKLQNEIQNQSDHYEKVSSLDAENSKLSNELINKNHRISELEGNVKNTAKEIDLKKKEFDSQLKLLNSKVNNLNDEIIEIKDENLMKIRENERLEEENCRLQQEMQSLIVNLQDAENNQEFESLVLENTNLKNKIAEHEKKIADLERNSEVFSKEINLKKKEHDRLSNLLKESERQSHEEITQIKDQIFDKIRKIEKLEEENIQLQEEIKSMANNLDQIDNSDVLNSLEIENSNLKERVNEKDQRILELEMNAVAENKEITIKKKELEKQVKSLKEEIYDLNNELLEIKNENIRMIKEKEQLEDKTKNLEHQIDSIVATLERVDKSDLVEAENRNLRDDLEATIEKLKELEAGLSVSQAPVDTKEIDKLAKLLKTKEIHFTQEITAIKDENYAMVKKSEKLEEERDQLTKRLMDIDSHNQFLESQISDMLAQLQTEEENLEILRSENAGLQEKLVRKLEFPTNNDLLEENNIKSLTDELLKIKDLNQKFEEENIQLKQRVQQLSLS